MKDKLVKLRNFAGIAVPEYYKITALKTESAKSSEIYVEYLKHLNEEIMYALFGSMGQRSQGGTFMATSNVIDEAWLRFLRGIRRVFDISLKRFYVYCLLPNHGIRGVKMGDIKIEWSPLHTESKNDIMAAIKIAAESGIFNDRDELRAAAGEVFPHLDESPASGDGYVPKQLMKQENTGFPNNA